MIDLPPLPPNPPHAWAKDAIEAWARTYGEACARAALEAAAQECDGIAGDEEHNKEVRDGAEYCAHAIRALQDKP